MGSLTVEGGEDGCGSEVVEASDAHGDIRGCRVQCSVDGVGSWKFRRRCEKCQIGAAVRVKILVVLGCSDTAGPTINLEFKVVVRIRLHAVNQLLPQSAASLLPRSLVIRRLGNSNEE